MKQLFKIGILLLLVLVPFGGAWAQDATCATNPALCATNKEMTPRDPTPYSGERICIRVIAPSGEQVNLHFVRNRGETPYRSYSKVADPSGVAQFNVGAHWVRIARREGHLIYGCDKSGQNGERYEQEDLDRELTNDPVPCISVPLCVLSGDGCPPGR